jgi:hypothetical protein
MPRERVAHHKVFVDAQLFPEFSNLILEHLPQRLDQFQLSGAVSEMCRRGRSPDPEKWVPEDSRPAGRNTLELFGIGIKYPERVGQASDIVMGFDGGTWS